MDLPRYQDNLLVEEQKPRRKDNGFRGGYRGLSRGRGYWQNNSFRCRGRSGSMSNNFNNRRNFGFQPVSEIGRNNTGGDTGLGTFGMVQGKQGMEELHAGNPDITNDPFSPLIEEEEHPGHVYLKDIEDQPPIPLLNADVEKDLDGLSSEEANSEDDSDVEEEVIVVKETPVENQGNMYLEVLHLLQCKEIRLIILILLLTMRCLNLNQFCLGGIGASP